WPRSRSPFATKREVSASSSISRIFIGSVLAARRPPRISGTRHVTESYPIGATPPYRRKFGAGDLQPALCERPVRGQPAGPRAGGNGEARRPNPPRAESAVRIDGNA